MKKNIFFILPAILIGMASDANANFLTTLQGAAKGIAGSQTMGAIDQIGKAVVNNKMNEIGIAPQQAAINDAVQLQANLNAEIQKIDVALQNPSLDANTRASYTNTRNRYARAVQELENMKNAASRMDIQGTHAYSQQVLAALQGTPYQAEANRLLLNADATLTSNINNSYNNSGGASTTQQQVVTATPTAAAYNVPPVVTTTTQQQPMYNNPAPQAQDASVRR